MCGEEDTDPNGPCRQYTEAGDVLRDLKSNLRDDKLLLMQVLASVWRKVTTASVHPAVTMLSLCITATCLFDTR